MKGDQKVIEFLNRALGNELVAINQYFLHAKMYKDWGFQALYEHEYHESIDEMKHADMLVERILFLEGLPNLQDLGKLMIGENTKEMLNCDLKLEQMAVPDLRDGIEYCESVRDYVTRPVPRNPRLRGRAHRLAGNPAQPDRQGRPGKLSAKTNGSRRRINRPRGPFAQEITAPGLTPRGALGIMRAS